VTFHGRGEAWSDIAMVSSRASAIACYAESEHDLISTPQGKRRAPISSGEHIQKRRTSPLRTVVVGDKAEFWITAQFDKT
jgi:hypothetical protein